MVRPRRSGPLPKPPTTAVTAGRRSEWTGHAVNPPVWRASTILYDDVAALKAGVKTNADGEWFYGRRGTPTQWSLAEAITALDPAAHATMLYPSGAAAVAGALLAVLKPGDHLLMVDSTYDPTRRLCDAYLAQRGVETSYYDPMAGAGIEALLRPNTRALFMESPGSLTFEVQDVPAIVAVARARGITTLIDNTWATPLYYPTASMGVDLTICAVTKYIAGHSDVMMGSVSALEPHWVNLRTTAQVLGNAVSPDDAYLAARGLRTLALRLKQQGQTALAVAHWLAKHPRVARVLHPAFADCPGHDAYARDFLAPGGLFGFMLKDGGTDAVIDALTLFGIGYSWGGYESLALPTEPSRCRSATRWDGGTVIRLSIGLEDECDLIADIDRALSQV
ncbi:cystathionine beta-lyase [Sphingomonas antarctica]|uniref:cystathionine beta-lyase n=1 Tax=Sphingomonas antarctica TaxID=2040274 RepID=UPI0039E9D30C